MQPKETTTLDQFYSVMEEEEEEKEKIKLSKAKETESDQSSSKIKEESDIKKGKIQKFLDSSIDMFNNILDDYEIKEKFSYVDVDMLLEKYSYKKIKRAGLWELIVFKCPGNIKILNSAIKKEMELGNSIFRILINFKFKKLYKYFKNDGTVITEDGKIFIFNEDVFKTLKYFKK